MEKESLRIIFMGTPDFAVHTLDYLLEQGYNIVAVVTMPDKPAGRGQHMQYSPVKQSALTHHLPVLQPTNLKDEKFLEEIKSYRADLQIVVAFRILPQSVWSMPKYGTFNLHASLLPQYRGAAPINWAIINGERQTGVTTFMLQQKMDTGNIILQESTPIDQDDDAQTLHDKLATQGKVLVKNTIDLIINAINNDLPLKTYPQPTVFDDFKPAPKLNKDNCCIDFTQTAVQIRDFVRGLSPYPTAWCSLVLEGVEYAYVKIYKVAPIALPDGYQGATQTIKGHIILPCKDGFIDILDLQLPNKKRMKAKDWLNGLRTH